MTKLRQFLMEYGLVDHSLQDSCLKCGGPFFGQSRMYCSKEQRTDRQKFVFVSSNSLLEGCKLGP